MTYDAAGFIRATAKRLREGSIDAETAAVRLDDVARILDDEREYSGPMPTKFKPDENTLRALRALSHFVVAPTLVRVPVDLD